MAIDSLTAFLSYSRDDLDFALRLAKDLKERGASVWMDKLDILPGKLWEREVDGALTGCKRVLVILSPTSVDSKNVMAEIALALDEEKEIIPVLFRECRVPFRLRPIQHADFRSDYAQGLGDLLRTLGVEQQAPPRGAAPPAGQAAPFVVEARRPPVEQPVTEARWPPVAPTSRKEVIEQVRPPGVEATAGAQSDKVAPQYTQWIKRGISAFGLLLFWLFFTALGGFRGVWCVIIGLIVGALAKLVMPGRYAEGIWFTLWLGGAGALAGAWLGGRFFPPGLLGVWILSVIGAVIVLAIYRVFKRKAA